MKILDIIIIFLGILFKYLLCYGINQTILYALLALICIITIINIYNLKVKKKELIKIMLFLIISIFFVILKRDVNFLISFLFSIIIIRKDDKSFIKVFFFSSLILFTLTIFLSWVGILESNNLVRYKKEILIIRYSLGFEHPNTVFLYFLPLALGGYYLYNNKVSYYILLILSSSILYNLCDSRTGYICTLSIILFHFIVTPKLLKKKTFQFILNHSILILTIFTILIAVLYGNDKTNLISSMFSGRPYYLNYYIQNGLIFTLLGTNLTKGYVLDNFYIHMLVQLGIIGYLIYYQIYKEGIKKINYEKKIIVILIIFLIYGLLETNVIIGSINFIFPILIKNLIINYKGKR